MNHDDDVKLRDALREAYRLPPDAGLEPDLWARMRRRLDGRHLRRSWVDWALAAAAGIWLLVFPRVIPYLLCQL